MRPDLWIVLLYAAIVVACILTGMARKRSEFLWWALAAVCAVLIIEHFPLK